MQRGEHPEGGAGAVGDGEDPVVVGTLDRAHGPALGEYVATCLADGAPVDAHFSLASKATVQRRTVF